MKNCLSNPVEIEKFFYNPKISYPNNRGTMLEEVKHFINLSFS